MNDARRGLPGQPIELAGGTHLFIDDYLIERTSALTRTAHRARRLPRPVLESGPGTRHTQVLFFPKVFHDPGNRSAPFRMRYDAGFTGSERRSYGYAESDDGLTWRFPELGIVEIAGSRANNIVRRGAYCLCLVDHARHPQSGTSDPERRFVLLYTGGDRFSAAYSPDGFHWTDDPDNPVYLDTEHRMEDRLNGCWDPLRGPLPGHRRLLRPARRRLHRQAAVPPRRLPSPGRPDHQHRPAALDALSPDRGL